MINHGARVHFISRKKAEDVVEAGEWRSPKRIAAGFAELLRLLNEQGFELLLDGEPLTQNWVAALLSSLLSTNSLLRVLDLQRKTKKAARPATTKIETAVLHSGGAVGADTVFGVIGEQYGVLKENIKHYYVEGNKTPSGNAPLTQEQANTADARLVQANQTLNRSWPTASTYVNNLLRRNWFQVKNSDAVFAISVLDANKPGTVKGGTGWAVQMAIDANKPVFVFDQGKKQWFTWDGKKFVETETPTLTPNFAGVGKRAITDAGKEAIRDVYEKTAKQGIEKTEKAARPAPEIGNRTVWKEGAKSLTLYQVVKEAFTTWQQAKDDKRFAFLTELMAKNGWIDDPEVMAEYMELARKLDGRLTPTIKEAIMRVIGRKSHPAIPIIKIVPYAELQQTENLGDGINVLRKFDAGEEHYGNPFSHLPKAIKAGAIATKGLKDSVDQYRAWLEGTAHKDVKQEQKAWILKQIDEGKLDGATLLYYSTQVPNHAEVLVERVAARKGLSNISFRNVKDPETGEWKTVAEEVTRRPVSETEVFDPVRFEKTHPDPLHHEKWNISQEEWWLESLDQTGETSSRQNMGLTNKQIRSKEIINATDQNINKGALGKLQSAIGRVIAKNFKHRTGVYTTTTGKTENRVVRVVFVDKTTDFSKRKGVVGDPRMQRILEKFRQDKKALGRFVRMHDADVILVDIEPFNLKTISERTLLAQARVVRALGHEFGHVIFHNELENLTNNKTLRDKLLTEWKKDRAKKGAPAQWSDKRMNKNKLSVGFEEWYADKMGRWLIDETLKPKNMVEGFFKQTADMIRGMFNWVETTLRIHGLADIRSERSKVFEEYVNEVIKSYKDGTVATTKITTEQKWLVRDYTDAAIKKLNLNIKGKGFLRSLRARVLQFFKSNSDLIPKEWSSFDKLLSHFVLTSYGALRKINPTLANHLYKRSATKGAARYLNRRDSKKHAFTAELLRLLPKKKNGSPDFDRINEILEDAERDVPIGELKSPEAKAVRRWLDKFYDTYIKGKELDSKGKDVIKKIKNYYPRRLLLETIAASAGLQVELAEVLQRYNPGVRPQKTYLNENGEIRTEYITWEQVVEEMITKEERNPDNADEGEIVESEAISIGTAKERAQYFNKVPTKALRDIGVLEPAGSALFKYVDDMVKRTEYQGIQETLTKSDIDMIIQLNEAGEISDAVRRALLSSKEGDTLTGWKAVELSLIRIPNELEREQARDLVRGMLGKTGLNMSPVARTINSWLLTLNIVGYLSLATIASLPDLAGPILRSRDMAAFKTAFQEIRHYFNNAKEMNQFARDVGVTSFDSMSVMYINAAEMGHMTPGAEKFTDLFFRGIGLEAYTRFTRVFALGMGEKFLINEAMKVNDSSLTPAQRETARRHLEELNGLTAEEVMTWEQRKQEGNRYRSLKGPEGEKIRLALATFVDESIVRPNSAERPGWASNPYTALIWQLKSFFYAYGVNIVGGAIRESKNVYKETGGNLPSAMVPFVIMGTAFLPLTMVGLELREWLKYLARGGDPGAFRSDEMSWPAYGKDIVDRSGLLGPFGLMLPMLEAGEFGGSWWVQPLAPQQNGLKM